LRVKGLVGSTPERIRTPNLLIRNQCEILLCVKWAVIMEFYVVLFVVPRGKWGKRFPDLLVKCHTVIQIRIALHENPIELLTKRPIFKIKS